MTKVSGSLLLVLGLSIAAFTTASGQSYQFSTLAGVAGSSGNNDGINQAAQFNFPVGVALDPTGNVFVTDFLNHTIRKLTLSGTNWITTTIAGLAKTPGYADGTNGDARFNRPAGIALDPAGDLFVAERYNHTIRKLTPVGTNWVVTTVAGLGGVTGSDDGTNTDARFYLPTGIAVDGSNHLFVADSANFTIREITPVGTNWVVSTIAGSPLNFGFQDGISSDGLFNYPYGVALGSTGTLVVADWGNCALRQLSRSGTDWEVTTIAGFSGVPGSTDGPGSIASFNSPTSLSVDGLGNIYVADQGNSTIRQLSPGQSDWTVRTIGGQALRTGSADGTGTNALFKKPWGIVADSAGNLVIADYSNSTIREGLLQIGNAPTLQILVQLDQVVLAWPMWATDFVLETTADLEITNSWTDLTNSFPGPNRMLYLTNTITAPRAFYRLANKMAQPSPSSRAAPIGPCQVLPKWSDWKHLTPSD